MEILITLLVVGVLLLAAEIILPGGIAGVIGLACLIGGIVVAYSEFGPQVGHLVLLGVLVGLIAGCMAWLRYFPESRAARLLISKREIGSVGVEQPELLGQTGTAFTQLRPSGTAVIDGKRIDVVTEGGMIDRGTPVKVVGIEGMRVVVRALDETTINQKQ